MNYLNVRIVKSAVAGVLAGWLLASCSSGYSLAGVEGGRVAITDVYDRKPDAEALNILKPYQQKVDSIMSPIIGHSAKNLTAYRPESPLSNLMADVLRQAAVRAIGKPADVAVMNMGGIRNAMPEGEITFGTVYEIAPFENALCVLTMDGATLKELFGQIASVHGEGEAFRRASSKIFPKDALLRNLLLDYVKQCEQKGQFVTSQVEGRIKVSASN